MKIASRIRLLGIVPAAITAAIVAAVNFNAFGNLSVQESSARLDAQLEEDRVRLQAGFAALQADITLLASLPTIDRYIEVTTSSLPRIENRLQLLSEQIRQTFINIGETRPHYFQLRLILADDEGNELIRVERAGPGEPVRPARVLQPKGQRPYVIETLKLDRGEFYVSPVTLNQEFGEVATPYQPTLRIAAPLHRQDGTVFGIVVINLDFTRFVQSAFPESPGTLEYYIADRNGRFVYHAGLEKVPDLSPSDDYTVSDEFPTVLAAGVAGTTYPARGRIETAGQDRLVVFEEVCPFAQHPEAVLYVGVSSPLGFATPLTGAATRTLGVTLLIISIVGLVALAVASRIVSPLEELTNAAQEIGEGATGRFDRISRDDEIGTLSGALSTMVSSLQKQRSRLVEANKDLQYFSRIAAHDLREPAGRMSRLASFLEVDDASSLSPQARDAVALLREEARQMVGQLSELRAFSRIGRDLLEREPVHIDEAIDHALQECEEELAERAIVVRRDPMPDVTAYKLLVSLLYSNLVRNALRHSHGDGILLHFGCDTSGKTPVFSVANTGSRASGDPERFFTAYHSESTRGEHSGLGLSNCRRIVERHAGTIGIDLSGDRFTVSFTFGQR